ncbi:molybdenum cofactor biosynthesis protein MoaE [bacterium]|nr:molybdenum cofactor biosynthesis protein MoaE [bacterium]MCI0604965.1 molybdenum cofactor biosynthesis protein MoaE [bacterium]
MTIHIRLFAAFADFAGTRDLQWDYHPGITCDRLWKELQTKFPRMGGIPALFAIRDEYVSPDTELQDQDSLMIFPPVSGGAASFIYTTALSVDRALDAIRDENGGGEAIFIGRVRRWNEGKRIRHLYYECHVSMAENEIAKIVKEMQNKWPLRKVHVEHRIGKLEIGDIAVIVAVSAEHRKEAMDACRYGIDELKHRVPIWKKEVSEDGEEWIGACEESDR